MIIELTDETLAAAISAHEHLLIDFYAEWCEPCKELKPTLASLSDEGLVVGMMKVDTAPKAVKQYGIRGVPTLIAFKNGKQVKVGIGSKTINGLREFLTECEIKY